MSIIKTYRYRIQPDKVLEFLAIQKQSDGFYREKVDYTISLYQSEKDPWQWAETHRYPSREMLVIAENILDDCPPLKILFQQFLEILDPNDKEIEEEIFCEYLIRNEHNNATALL